MELPPQYNPKETEDKIYKLWEESGYFNPDKLPNAEQRKPYTIMMPPPNATGILHAGHALFLTIEDIFIRFRRMQGYRTLWLPGTDHAAIATQAKVEKEISKKESKSRHDLGREELLRRINEFVENHRNIMTRQMRAMGSSCDWSREAFTLDQKRNHAVVEAFKRLYEMGLIYRGYRVVNWDPKGQTTISDDEIVYEERKAKLYTFKYSKDFPIAISTTRPETKVGDVAVAVHPEDPRYKNYVGKTYKVDFAGVPLKITIVADESVEKDFGTGALGVTPAHSSIDAEIAERHKLPTKPVINEYARVTVGGENIFDKKTTEARDAIVEWLKKENLLQSEEEITQNVATAERTGGVIEPLPKLQWFIAVNKPFIIPHSEINGIVSGATTTLKILMKTVAENGEITFVPERFKNNYFHWINNLRDWCISRQIWYGHRIPVWYHEPKCVPKEGHAEEVIKCKELVVSGTEPVCEFCNAKFTQDEDTLDTWFSSGLWTFSALGWPDETPDLKLYHPTDVLETAYEILFFWVARMILMTTSLVGQIPFKTVYLHGLVRDEKRKKLSKSKADSADPLDLIEKFGTDALRFALIFNTAPGTDSILSEEKIKGMKHFANKLWNITRFIVSNSEKIYSEEDLSRELKDDREFLDGVGIQKLRKEVTDNLESYKIHEASQGLYHFIWHEFADKYVEEAKPLLKNPETQEQTQKRLQYILISVLKLLHPFMPFVTEEIWQKLYQGKKLLMVEEW